MLEIEKKYKLTEEEFQELKDFLKNSDDQNLRYGAFWLEENTLYTSPYLDESKTFRIRRSGKDWADFKTKMFWEPDRQIHTVLTFKQRVSNDAGVKIQEETEFVIGTRDKATKQFLKIVKGLGFVPYLVYQKERLTYSYYDTEIALDKLPFGYYMEIEGTKESINFTEKFLNKNYEVEPKSYPALTMENGKNRKEIIVADF